MKYANLRQAFKNYFIENGHQDVESSSLIPHNDPTLMFTNAGMNQFKDVFVGSDKRSYNRAVTIQKCLRAGGKHNDLENVGFTARHHTFFEMMGNFSFGDYFKKEAIAFAWEFLTKTLNIPEERLYVTVFETDDEAAEIWHTQIGVPKEKIFRYGEKDNFWRMGQTGPCGPCSEIFYDHNPSGPKVALHEDEDRFVEIWNLVFMQFYEDESGKQTPLPKPSVDTGAGIERIAAAMQGFKDNYQTDIFKPLIDKACNLSGLNSDWSTLSKDPQLLGAVKVVADHARSAAFLISEGVLPSNEGRGYVLRRIMRRAIRYARKLNDQKSIYPLVCEEVIKVMGSHYPLLKDKSEFILSTVYDEEKRFLQTLDKGSDILNQQIEQIKKSGQKQISGELAFTLYDTFGFPLDLTELIAREQGLSIDEKGFHKNMEAAKEKARQAHKSHGFTSSDKHLGEWTQEISKKYGPTKFVGYEQMNVKSEILAVSDGEKQVDALEDSGWVITATTPFYAEGGGQVGDHGMLQSSHGSATVLDCIKMNDVFLHQVKIIDGSLSDGHQCFLKVEDGERQAIMNNHSATHLMHAALKEVLGSHVGQAGSLVNSQKLRFDFTHNQALTQKEIEQVEDMVNEQIALANPVGQALMSHENAIADGAVAMFGEKYGDEVRVISMGTFSKELCGGTHVTNTSQIRLFKIISEMSVSSGVRRIEAITGSKAFEYLNSLSEENLSLRKSLNLKTPKVDESHFTKELELKLQTLLAEISDLKKEVKRAKSESVSIDDILKGVEEKTLKGQNGKVLFSRVDISDRALLSDVSDKIREKEGNIVLVLIGESDEGPKPIVVAVSKKLKDIHAGKITKELCDILDGKGGGRPDFAQGSVGSLDKLKLAKDKFYELIQ